MAAQNLPNFVFALAPMLVDPGLIDYSTADRIKLWRAGIEPLAKEPFTLDAHKFKLFLTTLSDRAMTYRWGNILDIPIDAAIPAGPTRSMLSHYGHIMLQQIRDHAAIYANAQTHATQNSLMMYTCLATSIAPETKAKAMIYHQDYHHL